MSAEIKTSILDGILTPIYDTFFHVLGCIAGPMVVFKPTTAISYLSISFGTDQFLIPLALLNQAGKLGMVNREILKS